MNADNIVQKYCVNGVDISIRHWGRAGPACIVLHGLAEGGFVWEDFAERMSRYCRVTAIDLRGHGESSWAPHGQYSVDSYASDIRCILTQLGLKKFVLIGHSLGGAVAAKLASQSADNIAGLSLVDAGPSANGDGHRLLYSRLAEDYCAYNSVADYAAKLIERRPLLDNEAAQKLARRALSARLDGTYQLKFDLAAAVGLLQDDDSHWWWNALQTLHIPVQIIRGRGSPFLPKKLAEAMVRSLPQGTLTTVERAGHAVMLDNPLGFYEAAAQFVLRCLNVSLQ